MKSPKCVQKRWCIELTVPEMVKILDADKGTSNTPYDQMRSVGYVTDIEYDGHFGAYIWFTTDTIDGKYPVVEFTKLVRNIIKSL